MESELIREGYMPEQMVDGDNNDSDSSIYSPTDSPQNQMINSQDDLAQTIEPINDSIIDPITDPKNDRMHLFPIQFDDIWEMYKKAKASFWLVEEVDLTQDLVDWTKLNDNERFFIKQVLAFFAGSDFIVNLNLEKKFIGKITILELKMFYRFQLAIEDIHSHMYALLLETYVKDHIERENLKNAITTIPTIKKKADWAQKWINEGTIIQRLVAFAIVEGIFFSGSFCAIFWLKKRGKMPGLTFSNEQISKDEGMHRDMACIVYNNYVYNKLDEKIVVQMITDAVEIEKEFICTSLPVKLIGMNNTLMAQYVEFVADHLALNLINKRIYNKENPFTWMNLISIQSKTNFFEKRVPEYAKQMVLANGDNDNEIRFDADI
jgi:ribonucleotide reductase beta subunit family protein with ferritin-like domain